LTSGQEDKQKYRNEGKKQEWSQADTKTGRYTKKDNYIKSDGKGKYKKKHLARQKMCLKVESVILKHILCPEGIRLILNCVPPETF
jgi:hypothetical protein